jgi:hypothetical protein
MTVHQFDYDMNYEGPALPVVELGVTGRNATKNQVVSALINSGSPVFNGKSGQKRPKRANERN